MKIKILGYGEIGQAITKHIEQFPENDIFIQDPLYKLYPPAKYKFDFTLICIPYSDTFVQTVLKETGKIVIFSTVPIGTSEQIPNAIHIPIEGRHPDLLDSISIWQFFLGYNDDKYLRDYIDFFASINKPVIPVKGTRNTEALKLLSTLLYGVNLEFYRFAEDTFMRHGAGIKWFQEYNRSYNTLYSELGYQDFKRYILSPPDGEIGGHCVVPNAKLLDGIFSEIVKNTYKGVKV